MPTSSARQQELNENETVEAFSFKHWKRLITIIWGRSIKSPDNC